MQRKLTAAALGAVVVFAAATATTTEAAPTGTDSEPYQWFVPAKITGETASKAFNELPENEVCLFNAPTSKKDKNLDPEGFVKLRPGEQWYNEFVKNSPYPKYAKEAGLQFTYNNPNFLENAYTLVSAFGMNSFTPTATVLPKFYDPTNPDKLYEADYSEWWDGENPLRDSFKGDQIIEDLNSGIQEANSTIAAGEDNIRLGDDFMATMGQHHISSGTYAKLVYEDYLQSLNDCIGSLENGETASASEDGDNESQETPTATNTETTGAETEAIEDKVAEDDKVEPVNTGDNDTEGSSETGKIIGIVAGVIAAIAALVGAASFFAPQLGITLPF